MTPLYLVLAALAGGLAEALPLDGAAHLFLFGLLAGRPSPAVVAAVLTGAWLAVMAFQWRQVGALAFGLYRTLRGKYHPGARLLGLMVVAILPVVLADWLVGGKLVPTNMALVGGVLVVSGLLLFVIDRTSMTVQRLEHWSMLGALMIGATQALAIIPGLGRAGTVVLTARLLGFERIEAFRLSLLLAIPGLLYLVVSRGVGLIGGEALAWGNLGLAVVISFGLTLVGLALANWWVAERGFGPFALIRIVSGAMLIWMSTLA